MIATINDNVANTTIVDHPHPHLRLKLDGNDDLAPTNIDYNMTPPSHDDANATNVNHHHHYQHDNDGDPTITNTNDPPLSSLATATTIPKRQCR